MAIFTMLIGPAGCGKSTYSKELNQNDTNSVIVSSDAIRKELFGDENYQGDNQKVFLTMVSRSREYLSNGTNVIWDATSMSRKRRIGIIQQMPIGTIFHAVVVVATIESIMAQNSSRERVVPEDVIMDQIKSFQPPYFTEGFEEICIVGISNYSRYSLIKSMKNCQHDNPHHRPGTIWDHCKAMRAAFLADLIKDNQFSHDDWLIYNACTFHDCGKPFVQCYDDENIAHYKGHDGVGAYAFTSTLVGNTFTSKDDAKMLKVAVLIGEHMHMHRSDINIDKLTQRIGPELVALCERLKYYDSTYA